MTVASDDGPGRQRFDGPHFASTVGQENPLSGSLFRVDAGVPIDPPTGPVETHVYTTARRADGSTKELRMDVRLPPASAVRPAVVVFVPGGAFQHADRTSSLDLQEFLVGNGLAVCAVEYRLIPDGADFRDGITDVRDAVRHIRREADTLGVDGARIALWGDSAGGYLAAMAGLIGDDGLGARSATDVSSAVSAVVDRFGISDLSDVGSDFDEASRAMLRAPGSFPSAYLHGPDSVLPADSDPSLARRADPVTYARGDSPPFLLLHGDNDRVVSPRQTARLHRRLLQVGSRSARYVIPGAGHGDIVPADDPAAAAAWHTSAVAQLIASFLQDRLATGSV